MNSNDIRSLVRQALVESLNEADAVAEKPKSKAKMKKPEEPQASAPATKKPVDLAHELDLEYAGWGKWYKKGDPRATPVAMTKGDQLVRIDNSQPMAAEAPPSAEEPSGTPQEPVAEPTPTQSVGGVPGSIKPPMDPENNPIEILYLGQPGYIDKINPDHSVAITLHSGESLNVPKNQLKATMKKTKPKVTKSTAEMNSDELGIAPEVEKECRMIFKEAGRKPYNPHGETHVNPGWNKGLDTNDIPFDANFEDTVKRLLEMIGDPVKLVLWLKKIFQQETVNGKQRIMQYLKYIKDSGIMTNNEIVF